ncbi:MAG: hypothetical protein NTX25_07960 [Proteobacteria bacterium]|nr:hypothetical protein [Pseudomonadota bacterium]
MSNILRISVLAAIVYGTASLAAVPSFRFESNNDHKSFNFIMSNESDEPIACSLIDISVMVSDEDCTAQLSTYKYSIKNQPLKPKSKIENATFGIDFVALKNKSQKVRNLIYCGAPEVKFNCQ